jgi:hypothetical protein
LGSIFFAARNVVFAIKYGNLPKRETITLFQFFVEIKYSTLIAKAKIISKRVFIVQIIFGSVSILLSLAM